jgi:hypothetical protein
LKWYSAALAYLLPSTSQKLFWSTFHSLLFTTTQKQDTRDMTMATHRLSRHHPHLPPHMGDRLQTFFIPFTTSLRTIRCVGSSSATPVCTSGTDDHHGRMNSRFRPRPICGEAISPPIQTKPLPLAFE